MKSKHSHFPNNEGGHTLLYISTLVQFPLKFMICFAYFLVCLDLIQVWHVLLIIFNNYDS